jgi:uncharacterized protein involved in exopolysaccharide biosynthesis
MSDATQPLPEPDPPFARPLGRPGPAATPPAAPAPGPPPEDAGLVDYIYGVARRARWILLNAFFVGLVAALISLFLPHWYLSRATFLPALEERSTFSLTAFLREVAIPGGGLSDAVQAGDLSVALLKSRRVRAALIEEFDLIARYKAQDIEEALIALDAHSTFFVGQEGLVTVGIEDRDAAMAARMVNRSIAILDQFNAEQRMTKGQRTRVFVERELAQTAGDLTAAEEALEQYQTKTKLMPLSPQAEAGVSASAELLARKFEVEIALRMKQSVLRENNEEIRLLRAELAEIDRKLAELPAIGLDYARLLRNLKVREQVYSFLRTEYEQAKIQEERDTSSLTVVDAAEKPLKRARPRRTLLVLTAAGVAGVVSVLGALVLTWVDMLPPADHRRATLRAAGAECGRLFRFRRRRGSD